MLGLALLLLCSTIVSVESVKEKELLDSLFEGDFDVPPKLAPEAPKSVLDGDLALSDDALSESEILDEGDKAPALEAEIVPSVEPPAKEKSVNAQEKPKVVKRMETLKRPRAQPKRMSRKQKERERSEKVLSKISPKSRSIVKILPPIPRVVPPSPSPNPTSAIQAPSASPSGSVSALAKATKVKDKYTQSTVVRHATQGTQTDA